MINKYNIYNNTIKFMLFDSIIIVQYINGNNKSINNKKPILPLSTPIIQFKLLLHILLPQYNGNGIKQIK